MNIRKLKVKHHKTLSIEPQRYVVKTPEELNIDNLLKICKKRLDDIKYFFEENGVNDIEYIFTYTYGRIMTFTSYVKEDDTGLIIIGINPYDIMADYLSEFVGFANKLNELIISHIEGDKNDKSDDINKITGCCIRDDPNGKESTDSVG